MTIKLHFKRVRLTTELQSKPNQNHLFRPGRPKASLQLHVKRLAQDRAEQPGTKQLHQAKFERTPRV